MGKSSISMGHFPWLCKRLPEGICHGWLCNWENPQKNMFIFAALLFISHCVSHYYVHDDTGIFDINVLHPTNLLIYMWISIVLVLFQNIHFTYLYPQCLLDTFIPTMWPPPVLFCCPMVMTLPGLAHGHGPSIHRCFTVLNSMVEAFLIAWPSGYD